MSNLLRAALKGADAELEMDLKGLRATRIPSKMKREMRRKYAKRDKKREN